MKFQSFFLLLLEFPHLGAVLPDGILSVLDGLFLLTELLLRLRQLQVCFTVGLVFLVELLVQVTLVRIPLLMHFLNLHLELLGVLLNLCLRVFEVLGPLLHVLKLLSQIEQPLLGRKKVRVLVLQLLLEVHDLGLE